MRRVYRYRSGVVVEDDDGAREKFDDVVLACNANQALMALDRPTLLERFILSSIRYESELHNHAIVHSDPSVLPQSPVKARWISPNKWHGYHADIRAARYKEIQMPKTRPPYPAEFKTEAVRLCRASDRPRVQIAREPGCSVESLTHWLKQADVDDGKSEGLTTDDREELRRLRRENRVLREERAILKKAAAFFAREADPG